MSSDGPIVSIGISRLPAPSLALARSLSGRLSVADIPSQSPLQLFQLQLESGSLEASVDAMQRLCIVAQSLVWDDANTHSSSSATASDDANDNEQQQPNLIVTQLVPYIYQAVSSANPPLADELLLLLAQELSRILSLPLIPQQQYPLLLPLLEKLASVEETVVREQAVAVVLQLCEHLANNTDLQSSMSRMTVTDASEESTTTLWQVQIVTPLVAMWKRLATADWFTPKVSSCGMTPGVLQVASCLETASLPVISDILAVTKDLCADETPMVRRAAAQHLGKVMRAATWKHLDLISMALPLLVQDEQDSVRRLAVSCLADVGTEFATQHKEWTVQHWLPLVKEGSTDMSWYVCLLSWRGWMIVHFKFVYLGYSSLARTDGSLTHIHH